MMPTSQDMSECERLPRSARALLLAGAVALAAGVACWPAAADNPPLASDWSPEVCEILTLYHRADYPGARILSQSLLGRTRDAQVRRDVEALQALLLLRGDSRQEWQAGAAQLQQLEQEQPGLLARPECGLALGLARLELHETAEALDRLTTAATGFAERGLPDRAAAALVGLARAWSQHTEWPLTPRHLGVARPQDSAEAREIRRAQIAGVRARVAALEGQADALTRVDFILAEDSIRAGDRTADGYAILERIVAAPLATPAAADAALRLAEHHEQEQRWSEALALYGRLDRTQHAQTAAQRSAAITAPQLVIAAPASVGTHEPVWLNVRARNIAAVDVSVRAVALGSWLAERRGRYAPALLPEAGSLQLAREFATPAPQVGAWWNSDELDEPLEFRAPPGAYVVIARCADPAEHAIVTKELVVVSDLSATVSMGPQAALAWTEWRAGAASRPSVAVVPTARFWMFGSFVPAPVEFRAGVARFELPAEARVLRDKRWVLLVEAGPHLALCRGQLPGAAGADVVIALTGGPVAPLVGEALGLAGVLLPVGGQPLATLAAGTWVLEIRDVLGEVVHSEPLQIDAAGVFAANVVVTPAMSDRHLHIVVLRDGQVVENVRGRFSLRAIPGGQPALFVQTRVPAHLEPGTSEFRAEVRAWYPWGTPMWDARATCMARDVGLPTSGSDLGLQPGALSPGQALEDPGRPGRSSVQSGQLDESGAATFRLPLAPLPFADGPAAIGVWSRVFGWEGLQEVGFGETLLAPDPVHVWLRLVTPKHDAGQDLAFELGWFDPLRRVGSERPTLEVRSATGESTRLDLHADIGGLRSTPWRRPTAGEYTASATLPRQDDEPLHITRTFSVPAAPESGSPGGPRVTCVAQAHEVGDQAGVRVQLAGSFDQPLAIVVAAADPLAVQVVPTLDGHHEAVLPVPALPADARVLVAASGDDGARIIADEAIAPAADYELELHLEPPQDALLPGMRAAVRVRGTLGGRPAEAAVVARLVRAADSGQIHWLPGQTRRIGYASGGRPTLTSSQTPAAAAELAEMVTDDAHADLPPAVSDSLYAGETLWTAAATLVNGEAKLHIPLPTWPGVYRLIALGRTANGAQTVATQLLDTRAGVRLAADCPARLTLGDRTLIGVAVENPSDTRLELPVRIDTGTGLHLEMVRIGSGTSMGSPIAPGEPLTVTVAPGGLTWVQGLVEAAEPGAGRLTVELQLPAGRQSATAAYEVLAVGDDAASGTPLLVQRTLSRLELISRGIPLGSGVTGDDGTDVRWEQHAPRYENRFFPGEHLLVREVFTLPDELGVVRWSQRIPPNLHAALTDSHHGFSIGEPEPPRVDQLEYVATGLAAGFHTHEYHLVAVRAGACVLPPPEVVVNGVPLGVTAEPAELRISVVDVTSAP